MSTTPFMMPKLAMAMNEGTVTQWHVASGDRITNGQEIATIETEKVAYEIEASQDGFIRLVAAEGDVVPVETTIALIGDSLEELEAAAGDTPASEATSQDVSDPAPIASAVEVPEGQRIKITPLAKRIAKDAGYDYSALKGSGPGGRIKRHDIETALAAPNPARAVSNGSGPSRVIAATAMRHAIAGRMRTSLQESAQLSANWESDITDLLAFRKTLVAQEDILGQRISMNAVLAKIIAQAALDVPIVNAQWDGDNIRVHDTVNLAFAVAAPSEGELDSTLLVPVIRSVEKKGLAEIQRTMGELATRAREGGLTAADQMGSTLTFSSTAGMAPPGCVNTPILNTPNAALVGVSTAIERPVVRDGEIVIRTMMPVSLTFDHSLVDGEPVARFARALHNRLETPALLVG